MRLTYPQWMDCETTQKIPQKCWSLPQNYPSYKNNGM